MSGIASATTAATALSNLILVTPQTIVGYQPQNPPNADGTPSNSAAQPSILFHYEGENTVVLESDITDHFIEDNTAIQDQIALKPIIITTQGFVGELNDIAPKQLQVLQTLANKLTVIDAYTPVISQTALLAYNEALLLYNTASNAATAAVSAWNSVTGSANPNQTKQQIYFGQFFGYQQSRTLFTVQTPWNVFNNMAIMSLKAIQSPDSRMISDFEITFKQLQFAQTITTFATTSSTFGDFGSSRGAAQGQAQVQVGPNTPATSTLSFAQAIG